MWHIFHKTHHSSIMQTDKLISLQQIADHVNNVVLNDELIVFDSFSPYSSGYKELFPLRVDALIIILCRKGNGKIGIDLNEYSIEKGTLVVIQPQNYISLIEKASDDFETNIIACSKNIVEHIMPKLTDVMPLLISHRTDPVINLWEEDAESLNSFFNFLKLKLQGGPTPFLKQKVMCVLQAAMFEMMDVRYNNSKIDNRVKTRKEEIMAKFIISVSENFRTERQVSFYADDLCITPKHLSAVVKEISGRTAGEWIENYIIMEAKVLLKTSDLTIQEIATKLNFTNQSSFGKYFKHQTGKSPSEYRHLAN